MILFRGAQLAALKIAVDLVSNPCQSIFQTFHKRIAFNLLSISDRLNEAYVFGIVPNDRGDRERLGAGPAILRCHEKP